LQIGIIGSGEDTKEDMEIAENVGKRIAKKAVLVCGGLEGVMKGAARGCKKAGGTTVGILPGNSKHRANPYIDIKIPTGMGEARNVLVVKSSDVIISIGGGDGTLSEIALARKIGKLVISIGGGASKMMGEYGMVERAEGPEDAVNRALETRSESD